MIFHHEKLSLRMRQKLQLFISRQFVIERNQHAAAKENRISRNQPFRLIRHDNRGPRPVLEIRPLAARQRVTKPPSQMRDTSFERSLARDPLRSNKSHRASAQLPRARLRLRIDIAGGQASEARLDALSEGAEITYALQFVVRKLDLEMLLDARKQVERLQAIDS